MPKELEGIVDKMRSGLNELEQDTLFGADSNALLEACMEYAKYYGCSVHLPVVYPEMKRLDHLVGLFYSLFQQHYPGYTTPYSSSASNRRIAKLFIEARMKADGISRAKALEQCGAIIEIVFKYKDEFSFDPAPNFSIFGQQKMAWVTNRALELMNKDMKEFNKVVVKRLIKEQTAMVAESGEQFGWSYEDLTKAHEANKERK